ncbi:MAG: MFS transporter [Haloferacaceae archaeon]
MAASPTGDAPAADRRHAWVVLVACTALSLGFNAYTIAPASVLPRMAADFGIGEATAGLSISAVYLSWAVMGIPAGLLLDRYDNRRLVYVGVGIYVVSSVAGAGLQWYPAFLLARVGGGASAVFLWTANANIVRQAFPASIRAFGTSLFTASAPAGFALGQYAGPLVAARYGWRAVFFAYPVVTLAGAGLFALVVRRPVRNESAVSLAQFGETLKRPRVLAVSGASFCAYSVFLFLNSWMPAYATGRLGVDLAAAGAATALVPLSGVVARPGGGWLSDRLGGRRKAVIVAGFVLSTPVLVALTRVTDATAFATLLLGAGFFAQLGIGVFYVYVSELADAGTAGTSLAVLTTLSVLGSLVTPALTGWLVATVSWTAAFAYAVVLGVVGVALVAWVRED